MSQLTQSEDSLATATAAWGAASDLRARRLVAWDLAIFAAVRALADGVPLVHVMDALDFPMEPERAPDPHSFGLFRSPAVSREIGFAEWLGTQVTAAVERMANEGESA